MFGKLLAIYRNQTTVDSLEKRVAICNRLIELSGAESVENRDRLQIYRSQINRYNLLLSKEKLGSIKSTGDVKEAEPIQKPK